MRTDQTAGVLQQILDRSLQRHDIKLLVGTEMAPSEHTVSISDTAIHFWYRPYSEHGVPAIAAVPINSLADFMTQLVWPRMVAEWDPKRLMREQNLTEAEHSAIEHYSELQRREKELLMNDIDRLLIRTPHLQGLFEAIRSSDAVKLKDYAEELPGEVAEIGREHIAGLADAILAGQQKSVEADSLYLRTQILMIAGMPLVLEGEDWHSPEYEETRERCDEQETCVRHLAMHRCARNFLEVCLSSEMSALAGRAFIRTSRDEGASYRETISAFVATELATQP